MMENPQFYLESVVRDKDELLNFEGPLSLILMLLQKNKIEIRDIKVADILDQYLAYLERMEQMDLEIASEFVQMAAHLLYLKTKTLLSGGEEELSELELLKASLEQLQSKDQYERIREVCPALRESAQTGLLYLSKPPEPLPREGREYAYSHEPCDLLRALREVYARGVKLPESDLLSPAIPSRIAYSVKSKSRELLEKLRGGRRSLSELYRGCNSRSELLAAFLSVLELCSMGSIQLKRADDDYFVEFVGGDVNEIVERIEE